MSPVRAVFFIRNKETVRDECQETKIPILDIAGIAPSEIGSQGRSADGQDRQAAQAHGRCDAAVRLSAQNFTSGGGVMPSAAASLSEQRETNDGERGRSFS